MKKRKSSSLRRSFNTVNRSIKNQAVRIRNSLAETEKTLNKIAPNEDIKNKKEKNKKRSDTLWGLVCHACSKTAHSGNRGTSDRRVFHAFCDHDDCCWTDQQKNKLGNDLLYGLAAHCISLYQYYLEQSTSRFCH